jgi:hypothetical protein
MTAKPFLSFIKRKTIFQLDKRDIWDMTKKRDMGYHKNILFEIRFSQLAYYMRVKWEEYKIYLFLYYMHM